ncbi:MAG: formate dehydrogenase accessory sulfurtransferase FdhD [bacterium]|nr:formate dehydrogenase accessory sulfurtransferase FdhD [bacterium]
MSDHTSFEVTRIGNGEGSLAWDEVIREAPLLIRVNGAAYATLMRTPGQEKELALGFCFTEGLLPSSWRDGGLRWEEFDPQRNTIGLWFEPISISGAVASGFQSPSSWVDSAECSPIEPSGDEAEIIRRISSPLGMIDSGVRIPLSALQGIESQARHRQALFALTGAAHAACIFDRQGDFLFCSEDLARHNALDKAIGQALLAGVELEDKILFLSGRTNYTLIRKAARGRIPIVVSVSAPSSLAVGLSRRLGMTLIGFLRSGKMNIYAGAERIIMQ